MMYTKQEQALINEICEENDTARIDAIRRLSGRIDNLRAQNAELLEALRELCRVNELHDTVTGTEFIDAYNKAHEAIRKLKGD